MSEILSKEELETNGFIHTNYVAFAINKETDAIFSNEDDDLDKWVPKCTVTFLLGEEKEWDIKLYDVEGVKQRAIAQMKKLGIKWVYNVYCGDIFIPKDKTGGDSYHHIFARATIKIS